MSNPHRVPPIGSSIMSSSGRIPAAAFKPLFEIIAAIHSALYPTLLAVWANPSLLCNVHRREGRLRISRIFYYHVWKSLANATDQAHRKSKLKLIRGRVSGITLELGAGLGHTLRYLDPNLVTFYIACEPNIAMHPEIRHRARRAGFTEERFLITSNPAAQLKELIDSNHPHLRPGSIDTIISIHSFVSIFPPNHPQPIFDVLQTLLKPHTGKFLVYDYVPTQDSLQSRLWHKLWTPIWAICFGGCRLDICFPEILQKFDGWSKTRIWDNPHEDPKALFPHLSGEYVRRWAFASLLKKKLHPFMQKIEFLSGGPWMASFFLSFLLSAYLYAYVLPIRIVFLVVAEATGLPSAERLWIYLFTSVASKFGDWLVFNDLDGMWIDWKNVKNKNIFEFSIKSCLS